MHSYMLLYCRFYTHSYMHSHICIHACIPTRIQTCDIHMLIHVLFIHLAVFTPVTKRKLILTCPFLYIGFVSNSYHVYISIHLVVF